MKIIVDKIPENPIECYFSYPDEKCGWFCKLLGGECQAGSEWNECPCLKEQKETDNSSTPAKEEYIARSKLGLSDFEIIMCDGDYKKALKMLLDKIEKTPAADVVERKTAKWLHEQLLPDNVYGHMVAECSACHEVRIVDNYCPNCGSKNEVGQDEQH